MQLSVSQILSDTFAMLRARFWALVGMYLAWFAIMIGASLIFGIAMGGSMFALAGSDPANLGDSFGIGLAVTLIVFYAVYLLIACAQNAAMCTLASPLKQSDFGDAFGTGIGSAPTLLGVMIALVIAYIIGGILFGAIGGALSALGTAGAVVAGLLIFGVFLWLGARVGIVFPVVPVDGVRNPITAIGRAWSLTRGNAVPILLAFLAFIVIALVLFGIVALPFIGTLTAMGSDPSSAAAAGGSFILMFLGFIVVALVVASGYSALLSAIHGRLAGATAAAAAFE